MTDNQTAGAGVVDSAVLDAGLPVTEATTQESTETNESDKPPKTYTEDDFKRVENELARERRRIGKITAQKYQYKAQIDQYGQQIAELQKKIPQASEPDINKYSDYNKYQQDLIDHRIKLQTAPERPQQQQEDYQKQLWRTQRAPVLLSSVEQAKQTFPDIQQKLQDNAHALDALPMHVADALLESDAPALAIYQLIEDGMITHLSGMSPDTVAAMIERAEDRALSRQKPIQTTKAPAPMSPSKGTAPGSRTPESLSPDEIRKWMKS